MFAALTWPSTAKSVNLPYILTIFWMGRLSDFITHHQDSGHSNVSWATYAENFFTQIYSDLFGDAMREPIQMGTNLAAGNQQKQLTLSFATKNVNSCLEELKIIKIILSLIHELFRESNFPK